MPRTATPKEPRSPLAPLNATDAKFVERVLTDVFNLPAKSVGMRSATAGEEMEYLVLTTEDTIVNGETVPVRRVLATMGEAISFLVPTADAE